MISTSILSEFPTFASFVDPKYKMQWLKDLYRVSAFSSGLLLGQGLVLTAAHAVNQKKCARILYKDRLIKAEVLVRLQDIDIMLLKVKDSGLGSNNHAVGFSNSVNLGEKLYIVGFPLPDILDFQPLFYSIDVTALEIKNKPHLIQVNGDIWEGCSGMILVNDRLEVAGVINSKKSNNPSIKKIPHDWNFATRAEYFINSIEAYLPRRSQRQHLKLSPQKLASHLHRYAVPILACEK